MEAQYPQSDSTKVLPNFSLYVNGQFVDATVITHNIKESRIYMLPVGAIAATLGYNVEINENDSYAQINKANFSSDNIIIRYVSKQNKIIDYYYSMGVNFFDISTPPEPVGNELYAPAAFFEKAFGCTVNVSDNGNVLITTI